MTDTSPNNPPLDDHRLAIISYSGPPVVGGVENLIESQSTWLSKYGARVSVYAGKGEDISPDIPIHTRDYLASGYRPEFSSPDRKPSENFRSVKTEIKTSLRQDLAEYNTWIIHNVLTMPFNMVLTAALHELVAETSARVIQWTHDIAWLDSSHETPDRYPWTLLASSPEVTRHVVISDHRKQQLRDVYDSGHPSIRVVYDAVEVGNILSLDPSMEAFYHRHELYRDDITAVYPARLVRRKNFEKALSITSALIQQGHRVHLIITGPVDPHNDDTFRYREELFNLTHSLDLEDNVIFCCREHDPEQDGPLEMTFDRVKQLYRISDVLLMTSRQEGFGMPVVEAGLTGTVICCSDREPLPEIAGEHAVCFDVASAGQTIAERIVRRLENDLSVNARRRMRQNFSWPALMEDSVLPLFNDLPPVGTSLPPTVST